MTAMKKKTSSKAEASAAAHKTAAPKEAKGANANDKKSSAPLIIGGIAALVALLAVVVFLNMGSLAKGLIEKIATDTLGVQVTLAALDIKPVEKTVTVTGLRVANPQGFKNQAALTVGRIGIMAESLSPELLVFKKIDVEGTEINLEVTENATNLTTIRENVDGGAAAKPVEGQKKQPPKVIVRELVFNGVTLNPAATVLGGDLMPVNISNLRMAGIGERQNGVLASEAIAQVLEQLTKTSVQAGIQAGYMQGMSPEALGQMKSQMGIVDSFREQAKQGFENLKSGVRNLFGGSEESQPTQQ